MYMPPNSTLDVEVIASTVAIKWRGYPSIKIFSSYQKIFFGLQRIFEPEWASLTTKKTLDLVSHVCVKNALHTALGEIDDDTKVGSKIPSTGLFLLVCNAFYNQSARWQTSVAWDTHFGNKPKLVYTPNHNILDNNEHGPKTTPVELLL